MMIDLRVQELYRRIDLGLYDLLSLDIFDTTVYRRVPHPKDVFFLMARALQSQGALWDSSTPESFVRERINAEDRARLRKYFCTEVTLDEICAEFPRGYLRNISPQELVDVEMRLQKDMVSINPEMEGLIEHARRKGLKIAFVSDTYFIRPQIRALVDVKVDYTVLSCEHGISKYQGLHRVLIEESAVPPGRILHVGDNYEADIEGPKIYQIERYWFEKFPAEYKDLIDLELPKTYALRSPYIAAHDRGLTWMRSRAVFACENDYQKWGAVVLGPVIACFAEWIAQKCKSYGIRNILCLMREGRILKKVLDTLYPNAGFVCHEFFVSRYTALQAAIFEATEDELKKFVFRSSSQRLYRMLDQLGLQPEDIDRSTDELLSPEASGELIRRIVQTPVLRQKVIRSSRRARENLLKHLDPLLDDSHSPQDVAVTDLGYSGTIQAVLQSVLSRERPGVKTRGLYLVTGGDVHKTQSTGAIAEGWLAENGQPISMAHTFMRSPEVVEQSLMADCGTTLGYDNRGEPVLDALRIPERQIRQINDIQSGLLTFCRMWAEGNGEADLASLHVLKNVCQRILIRSVAEPLDIELKLFGEWVHDENLGSETSRPLLGCSLDSWELNHASVQQLASLRSEDIYWPFGLAWQMGENMGASVAHVFLRTVEPQVFNSGLPDQPMIFYWDTGRGFHRKNSRSETYSVNNRHRVWKRLSLQLDHSTVRMFGFSVGLVGDVLQLTGVVLHYRSTDGRQQIVRIGHEDIEKSGYRHLYGNLYAAEQDPVLLTVPSKNNDHFTGTVHVDIFFAIIKGVV